MLEKVRKPGRGKAITAYVIFGAICLVFVFLGIAPQGPGFVSGGAAATVNDKVISQKDFRDQVRMTQSRYALQLDQMPAKQRELIRGQINQQALESLIQQELLAQVVNDLGVSSPDGEVRDYILSIPSFNEKGQFQRMRYDRYLEYSKMTPGQFEDRIRRDLSRDRLVKVFTQSLDPVALETEKDRQARETKLEVSFVSFDKQKISTQYKPKANDKRAFMDSEDGKKKIKAYFDSHKSEYTIPTQLKVSHILINAKRGDQKAEKAAYEKIQNLRKEALKGDFGKVAEKNSQDPVSAKKQGSLDYIKKGQMVKEFEDKAFSMKVGEISEPVQTQYGYHLIKVFDRKEGGEKKLEEVQAQIAEKVLGEEVASTSIEELKKGVKESADKSAKLFLKKFKMKWESTGEFGVNTTSVPKISDEKVLDEVLQFGKSGEVVNKLIESRGKYYLVKLNKVVWPKSEDKGLVGSQYLASRNANEVMTNWVEEFRKNADIRKNPALLSN